MSKATGSCCRLITPAADWSERLADCRVAEDAEIGAELLAVAAGAVADRLVVEPYLFDVDRDDGAVRPRGRRETIRALGPSVRPDLGYQAATAGD